jgi:hypothetical protein
VTAEREWLREFAANLGVAPKEVTAAIALMRSGRGDLVAKVMARTMTVREARSAQHVNLRDRDGFGHIAISRS